MALNPLRYLAVPNVIAGVLAMPLLGAMFSVIGIYGAYLVGVQLLGINSSTYFGGMRDFVDLTDVTTGLYKSLSFGLIIMLICCFKGYYAGSGATGVSKATTEAVVLASVSILILDYFLNTVLL
jgi:phospholipid/cholesterol/gamma-HCH transport system permease protein